MSLIADKPPIRPLRQLALWGTIGPRIRLMTPEAEAGTELARLEAEFAAPIEIPEVIIPPEDRKTPAE